MKRKAHISDNTYFFIDQKGAKHREDKHGQARGVI